MTIEKQDPTDGRYSTTIAKINELVEHANRQAAAIHQLAQTLVTATNGMFNSHDAEQITKILYGESTTETASLGEGKQDG